MQHKARIRKLTQTIVVYRRAIARAQHQLAAVTRPEDGSHCIEPSSRWAHDLQERRAPRLLKTAGVLGHGLGYRQRDGLPTSELCLRVFVREKLTAEALRQRGMKALPHFIGWGKRRLGIDVVQLGILERHTTLGESVGPSSPAETGTVGALGRDNVSGHPVALTAMHITGVDEIPGPGLPRLTVFVPSAAQGGTVPYGDIVAGSMTGLDACKIELRDPAGTLPSIPYIGPVRGWRPMLVPGDRGAAVRMYGALSQYQAGVIDTPLVSLPQYSLDAAILVRMNTQHGDSGAALVDAHDLILGFLVGQMGEFHVFCAAGPVLVRLGCDIPTCSE